ncbi:MAG TPA: hypothetical protein VFC57_01185 [Aeromicrobium sp.]|nr:hypothetical protein [Aeromicrobium sp.]
MKNWSRLPRGHTAPIGYVATTLNGQPGVISDELGVLADLATTATSPVR